MMVVMLSVLMKKQGTKRFPKMGTEKHNKNVWEFDSSRKYQKRTCELKKSTLWAFGRGPENRDPRSLGKFKGKTYGIHTLFYVNVVVLEGIRSETSYGHRKCLMAIGDLLWP